MAPPLTAPRPGQVQKVQVRELRELRAEVQDLRSALQRVRNGEVSLQSYADYIQKTTKDIAVIMAEIRDGKYSDQIRHLHNIWEQLSVCPLLANPKGDFATQDKLRYLVMIDGLCREIIFNVGVLTIPERVNDWLAEARPGYYIPFHSVFDDELPAFEDRRRVLNYLAWAPEVIRGGLVNQADGLIYRYSTKTWDIIKSIALLVVSFVIAAGIVVGACWLPVEEWPIKTQHLSVCVIGWGAVLAGVVVHMGVGTAKRMRTQGEHPPVLAVWDLQYHIDAKVGQMVLKLFLTLVGFFGLAFTAGIDSVTPMNAFLVGYSLDSVVELFGASIEQQAASQVATLKQQLGITSDESA